MDLKIKIYKKMYIFLKHKFNFKSSNDAIEVNKKCRV